jgi:hypothetical protein
VRGIYEFDVRLVVIILAWDHGRRRFGMLNCLDLELGLRLVDRSAENIVYSYACLCVAYHELDDSSLLCASTSSIAISARMPISS